MATPSVPPAGYWKRVTQLTADALERPANERAAWLALACAGDDALRHEVESLLAADAQAGRFLQDAAIASQGAAEVVAAAARESLGLVTGRLIGPYRIVRELGHGGMGVVYLAARADRVFEKEVAIKVVRGGAGTEVALQRFREERRILATLEHPNIARLLDGGVTAEGLAYFVMEYVDGVPLDVYCEKARLTLTDRLQLFGQVCAAVQYAHQRLVIHRDIKSRNILVTSDGAPKLLDFGIAKLLDQDMIDGHTRTGLRAFTLENASPEQILGQPMAVTSDVYALGVLLYHVITGQRPCGNTASTDAHLLRAICDEPPMRPTLAARAGFTVSPELEWIVLKALRKEPDRRYESVEQFADDVRRLLSARPVMAAPDSWRYRARKFVTRNRGTVAAAALVMLSIVAGLTATLWQARRADQQRALAEQRLQNTRRVAQSLLFELHDAIAAVPGATAAKGLLLTRAAEQLDAIALETPDDPALLEELAVAYHRLADVQGLAGSANLGDRPAALINHRKGLALRTRISERSPNDLEAKSRLVESLLSTAGVEDDAARALEQTKSAVALAESLHRSRGTEPRFIRGLASAHYAMGVRWLGNAEAARALTSFEAAAPLYQTVYDASGDAEVRRSLALCHKRLGAILGLKDPAQAVGHIRRAVELDEAGVAAAPNAPQRRRDLSTSSIQLGFVLTQLGDRQQARAAYQRALSLREDLMGDDPRDTQAIRDVASALWYVGNLDNGSSRPQEAMVSFRRALPLAIQTSTGTSDMVGLIIDGLAQAHENLGEYSEAISLRRQSLAHIRAKLAGRPADANERQLIATGQMRLGDALMRLARLATEPAVRATRKREACAAYQAGWRESERLNVDAVLAGRDQQLRDELRSALASCQPDRPANSPPR